MKNLTGDGRDGRRRRRGHHPRLDHVGGRREERGDRPGAAPCSVESVLSVKEKEKEKEKVKNEGEFFSFPENVSSASKSA